MEALTLDQCVFIVKIFYEDSRCNAVVRPYSIEHLVPEQHHLRWPLTSVIAVQNWSQIVMIKLKHSLMQVFLVFSMVFHKFVKRFEKTGSVHDARKGHSGRPASVVTLENVEQVRALLQEQSTSSTKHAAQQLRMSWHSLQRIMNDKVNLFPYKIQLCQPLKDRDVERQYSFANKMIEILENGTVDKNRIWFNDKAHFHLHGYVNKQNWYHWGNVNPHVQVAAPLHPQKVTV